jgi:hypothetical protein
VKSYGNLNFQNNFAQEVRFDVEQEFPTDTNRMVGRIIFKDKRLYICVEIASGLPVWVPLTNEMDTYVHTQVSGSTTWNVTHNLKTNNPLVQVYEAGTNVMMIPDEVLILSRDELRISFGDAVSGRAIIMFGDITGGQKTSYAYEYFVTTPSNTWVITHGLGYEPIVRVFVDGQEVQPYSIVHDSMSQTTISFTSPQVGVARFI